jgi:hypothetical protein
MSVIIKGGDSSDLVTVTSDKNLKVTTPLVTSVAGVETPNQVGAIRMFAENDSGTITGTAYLKSPEVSIDYRQRVGIDTVIFSDTFNSTTQNTANWRHAFTTMTATQSAGFLNINAAGTSTVSGNFAYMNSFRYFPIIGTAPLAVEFSCAHSALPTANEVLQFGLGIATGAADPIDGVWFEYTSAGLKGATRYNSGTVVKTDLVANLSINQVRHFTIVVGEGEVEFWIDDVLYGEQIIPVGQGQPFMTSALPVFMQKYNAGTVGASPNLIARFGDVNVSIMDIATNQTWANQMAGYGLGLQGLNGGTMGSPQVQWANTALPTAAAATNTTAALGAFMGGIFLQNAPATGATDLIVSSWLNPAGGVNQTPRTMKIRGIKIDCVNMGAAVATTATVLAVAIAWGGTQLSLGTQTADSTTFANNTAKMRRIQPLGIVTFPIGAAIGAAANSITFDFEAPIVINPTEYAQIVVKPLIGTATGSQVLHWIISPNLYHE